jgi:membrane protein involved in colicin uptake
MAPRSEPILINEGRAWLFPNGRILPVIAGGQKTEEETRREQEAEAKRREDEEKKAEEEEARKKKAEEDARELGESGKRALDLERQARRDAEKRAKKAEEERDALKKAGESDQEKAVREATDTARKEEREKANERIVKAEVRARAGTKLQDPEDAVRLLDLSEFTPNDDGEVDHAKIDKAIDELLKSKPYLGAKGTGKPSGSADGGARKGDKPDVQPGQQRLSRWHAENPPPAKKT